jgi:hypothetical protein
MSRRAVCPICGYYLGGIPCPTEPTGDELRALCERLNGPRADYEDYFDDGDARLVRHAAALIDRLRAAPASSAPDAEGTT